MHSPLDFGGIVVQMVLGFPLKFRSKIAILPFQQPIPIAMKRFLIPIFLVLPIFLLAQKAAKKKVHYEEFVTIEFDALIGTSINQPPFGG